MAAPFALIGSRNRGAFLTGAAAALLAVLAATIPLYGHSALDSLALLGDNQNLTTRLSLPRAASNLPLVSLDGARASAFALYGVALAGLLAWTWRGGDWVRAALYTGASVALAVAGIFAGFAAARSLLALRTGG